jgi:hypothetical protein
VKSSDFPQLDAMRDGVDYRFNITCRKFSVAVRPLTNLEVIQATAAAADAYESLPENQRSSISASLLSAMHQLEKASSPDVGEPGRLTLAMLQMMTPDEVNHLWKQYVRVTDKVNPSFDMVGHEQLGEWADELKKNSDPLSLLTDLSISSLIALCHHLSRPSPG